VAFAIDAFNDSETLTAAGNGSGNLELIAWRCAQTDAEVTRICDSDPQARTIGEVALSVIGRTVITTVHNGSGNLRMIVWDVPPGQARSRGPGTAEQPRAMQVASACRVRTSGWRSKANAPAATGWHA